MTAIMHQMTEYTRGEGQLKTNKGTKAIINYIQCVSKCWSHFLDSFR